MTYNSNANVGYRDSIVYNRFNVFITHAVFVLRLNCITFIKRHISFEVCCGQYQTLQIHLQSTWMKYISVRIKVNVIFILFFSNGNLVFNKNQLFSERSNRIVKYKLDQYDLLRVL